MCRYVPLVDVLVVARCGLEVMWTSGVVDVMGRALKCVLDLDSETHRWAPPPLSSEGGAVLVFGESDAV